MWQALNIKRIRITHCLGLSGKSSELRSRLVLEQEGNRSLAEKGTTESAERWERVQGQCLQKVFFMVRRRVGLDRLDG